MNTNEAKKERSKERAQREKRIDHYVKNYSVRTLAEMIVSLEDQHGVPSAID